MSGNSNIKKIFFQNDEKREDPFESVEYKEKEVISSQPPTTKFELWSYYLYFSGDNGLAMYSYMPVILQYLAYRGGFDPSTPSVKGCDIFDTIKKPCHVNWIGIPKSIPVTSMLLYVQAIAFSIQFIIFTFVGSLADYGQYNRYLLLFITIIACAAQIVPITLVDDDGSHWYIMMVIMIIGTISFGASFVFFCASFPNLSDNLPIVKDAMMDDSLSKDEKSNIKYKWRNRVSAVSTTYSYLGFLLLSAILSGITFIPWKDKYDFNSGVEPVFGNTPLFNFVGTVLCGSYWAISAIPYFIVRPKGRQGPPLPENANYFTIGWISIFTAVREAKKLRYLFMYMFAYFIFSDAVATITQMTIIIQAKITSFSAKQNTLLRLVTAIASVIGCLLFLWISKRFHISTKANLLILLIGASAIAVWSCLGIHFDNLGLKTTWELWLFNVWQGLFISPIYAWQQTMLSELIPKGKENLFFGLFGIVNKGSAWVGPVIIGAITEKTSNIWMGFPLMVGLLIVSIIIILCIDMEKAKKELAEYEKQSA